MSTLKLRTMHIRPCRYWSKPVLLEICVRLLAVQDLYTLHVPKCYFRDNLQEPFLSNALIA
jgi:hypothetical protein